MRLLMYTLLLIRGLLYVFAQIIAYLFVDYHMRRPCMNYYTLVLISGLFHYTLYEYAHLFVGYVMYSQISDLYYRVQTIFNVLNKHCFYEIKKDGQRVSYIPPPPPPLSRDKHAWELFSPRHITNLYLYRYKLSKPEHIYLICSSVCVYAAKAAKKLSQRFLLVVRNILFMLLPLMVIECLLLIALYAYVVCSTLSSSFVN